MTLIFVFNFNIKLLIENFKKKFAKIYSQRSVHWTLIWVAHKKREFKDDPRILRYEGLNFAW